MYYSYVMGIDESIYELEKQGFSIEKDKKIRVNGKYVGLKGMEFQCHINS